MKVDLTKRQIEVLINHTKQNLSWGEGGSFIDDDQELDTVSARIAERAVAKLQVSYNK